MFTHDGGDYGNYNDDYKVLPIPVGLFGFLGSKLKALRESSCHFPLLREKPAQIPCVES